MSSTPTPGTNCLHNKRPVGQHLGSGPSSFHSRDLEPLTRTFLASVSLSIKWCFGEVLRK